MRARVFVFMIAAFLVAALLPPVAEGSYKTDIKRVAKRTALYDLNTGDAMIIVHAMFFTDEFRVAFAEKSAAIRHLSPAEADAWHHEQRLEQARGWEIFVGMYTRKAYRDFSLAPDTFWKAVLATETGEHVAPVAIEKIKVTPYWRVMFPNLTHWDAAYRVVFPKVSLGSWADLTLQSVVGEAQLGWTFKQDR